MVESVENIYFKVRSETMAAALARIKKVVKEYDLSKVKRSYYYYTKRLHDCRRAGGQMTEY